MAIPVVAITNQSTALTDIQVQEIILPLQKQVSSDFRAYWNVDATVTFLPAHEPLPKGWWQIVVLDDPDQAGALGYHELSSQGTPLGKVFAKLDLAAGSSWSVTTSHELLEMLGDPWINWIAESPDGKFYALEVCDPVEDDSLGYEIYGVKVSDFITPAWYEPTEATIFSFKKSVSTALTLAPGGYISVLDPSKGWTQVMAEASKAQAHIPLGSRRSRRSIPKSSWRKSLR